MAHLTKKALPMAAAIAAGSLLSAGAQAETIWSDNSITLLYGEEYEIVDEKVTTMTLEHVSGHNWGDVFMFLDRHNGSDTDYKETYAELSPRLSLSYLTGSKMEFGPVKDVLLAGTYEFMSDNNDATTDFDNYLMGFGIDWNVPGFAFFQTNFYHANNEATDDDQQITVVYGVPFSVGELDIMIDGYIDWSTGEEDHGSDFHFNPQVRADVGKFMGITKSKLEVGFEYSYWHNKFGIKDDDFVVQVLGADNDESAFSALVKFHL
jgi:nucleoside-specific outer membrane channel protein Tsx